MVWRNVSQHIGNKDNFLSSDENILVMFNMEGLSLNDNPVSNLNYEDTDGMNRSVPNQLEPVSIPKLPLS